MSEWEGESEYYDCVTCGIQFREDEGDITQEMCNECLRAGQEITEDHNWFCQQFGFDPATGEKIKIKKEDM